jgi:cytoskeletal protein CcmA (bactofilin family)
MRPQTSKNSRAGAALLVVLFVVMAVTVLSLGFLARSSIQMAAGQNMALRMQMDFLAQSALTHAKTLIMNPQDVTTGIDGYWQGGSALFIAAGDDYYDIAITRSAAGATNRCTYDIQCQGYRMPDGKKIAQSNLNVQLRLDPYIAYWAGGAATIPANATVNGDIYCSGNVTNNGIINGDVFTSGTLTGSAAGQSYLLTQTSVTWPEIDHAIFSSTYYINTTSYFSENLNNPNCADDEFGSTENNPSGIVYRNGDLTLGQNVTINGTLVVNGNLTVQGAGNEITADKNFPALVVNGELIVEQAGQLTIEGLVQTNTMTVHDDAADINILGALFIRNGSMTVEAGYGGSINITAAPMLTSLKTYPSSGTSAKWSPVGGAFFKHVRRY